MFAMTSGTTAARKLIPVNDQYLADYRRGWNLWGLKIYRDHPEVRLRPIVQLSGDWQESFTPGGIPCGAVTGSDRAHAAARRALDLLRAWLRRQGQGRRRQVLSRAAAQPAAARSA